MSQAQTEIETLLLAMWGALSKLEELHEELTDTDVREALHETLNWAFVWGRGLAPRPLNYRMFSKDGDRAVAKIVEAFVSSALPAVERQGIPAGQARHELLQAELGPHDPVVFIGYGEEPLPNQKPPHDLFEEGEYDDTP